MDREIDAELRAHIEMRIDDNVARGMSAAEARREARVRFGNPVALRERTAAADAALALAKLWADLRYSVRRLAKAPAFTAATVLTLALGIGATTAIFSAMDAVLLRTMPVENPQQLYYLHVPDGQPNGAHNTGDSETSFSMPVFSVLRQQTSVFRDVMAFAPLSWDKVALRFGSNAAELGFGEMVSGNFFSGLGVRAQQGRVLTMADEQQNAAVAVLSYAYWHSRFGSDPRVVGETVYIKGIPFTVVGVATEGFPGVEPGSATDLWVPLQRQPALNPWGNAVNHRLYGSPDWWCLRVLARLAPGVSIERAIAQVTPAFQAEAYARLAPDLAHPKIRLSAESSKGMQGLGDLYRKPIVILMVLVSLVLAIACSNVAMLMVARNAARQKDFSLRMALGAGRGVLLRQLLVESAVLVVAGAALGWLFAVNASHILAAWFQLDASLAPDGLVLAFTAIISTLAALLFGLAPMRSATGAPVSSTLRAGAASQQGRRGGTAVLAVQVAMCFTLLTAAGLLLRTLQNFEHTRLGMRSESPLVFGLTPQTATTAETRFRFYRELLERMRALPGVEGATFVSNRPGSGWSSNEEPTIDGVTTPYEQVPLRENSVGPDFLGVMGVPLLAGRDLRDSDTASAQHVVIVNETFVKKLLPHTNPLGHQLGDLKKEHATIVGVATDSKYRSVDEAPRAMAYFPYEQSEEAPATLHVELRTAGNPMALLPEAEAAVHAMDPNLPLQKPETQAATFAESYAQQRVFSRLAMFFALLAALLVGIGLYGTLSYRISRRSAEIGVRMALGAKRAQVLGMVLRECLRIAVVGIAIGIPLALLAGKLMQSMLYGLGGQDVLSLMAALLGIIGISFVAGWIPARRAASIDPVQVLRAE
jgi:predicted permease